jgi:hypothetical protein
VITDLDSKQVIIQRKDNTFTKCNVETCTNLIGGGRKATKSYGLGYCSVHYAKLRKHGNAEAENQRVPKWGNTLCLNKDCKKKVLAKGLCSKHYGDLRRSKAKPELKKQWYAKASDWKRNKQEKLMGRARPSHCELCNQHGIGGIASKPDSGIVFDHCHITGKSRGWICDRCNKTLGMVQDNKELLAKMITYLEVFNGL